MPGQISESGFDSKEAALNFAQQIHAQDGAHISVIDPSGTAAMVTDPPAANELRSSQ